MLFTHLSISTCSLQPPGHQMLCIDGDRTLARCIVEVPEHILHGSDTTLHPNPEGIGVSS